MGFSGGEPSWSQNNIAHAALNQGSETWNTIRVVMIGNAMTLYANDTVMKTMTDDAVSTPGTIRLAVEGDDYFQIKGTFKDPQALKSILE